jgi:hypothetical protein
MGLITAVTALTQEVGGVSENWDLRPKKNYLCLLSPDRPYFFTPTLQLNAKSHNNSYKQNLQNVQTTMEIFLKIYKILEILSLSGTKWVCIVNNS